MYNTIGDYADEQETNINRTPQNPGSPVMNSQEIQYVPPVYLVKTTREGISPFRILPEEFKPIKSWTASPIREPSGVLPELDGETVSEMLVKVSILGLISQNPNISPENLTNHLYGFPLRSRAINVEYLNRVQTQKVIIPEEANKTLQLFRR